jgi:hypothetical protein
MSADGSDRRFAMVAEQALDDIECAECFKLYALAVLTFGQLTSIRKTAVRLGWKEETVRRHADHLKAAGWVELEQVSGHSAIRVTVIHDPARKGGPMNTDVRAIPKARGRSGPRRVPPPPGQRRVNPAPHGGDAAPSRFAGHPAPPSGTGCAASPRRTLPPKAAQSASDLHARTLPPVVDAERGTERANPVPLKGAGSKSPRSEWSPDGPRADGWAEDEAAAEVRRRLEERGHAVAFEQAAECLARRPFTDTELLTNVEIGHAVARFVGEAQAEAAHVS